MIAEQIAKDLLSIEAVSLSPDEPFTWASGLKSPIYCDNRVTMSYPEVRRAIAQGLAAKIKEEFPNVEVIAGTATAGIPHAAWVAEILDLPMVYIRSKAKDILGVAAIFTYELAKGKKNFEEANTPLTTLTNYSTLIESALQENYINQEQLELLKKWRKDPENWLN